MEHSTTLQQGAASSSSYPTLTRAPGLERVVPEECPECGSRDILEDWREGNAVCRSCGLVVSERLMDFSSEWRTFADDEGRGDPSRVSGPANPLFDNPNHTGIGEGASGRYSSLAQTARRTVSSKDRAMVRVSGEIDTFLSKMNTTSTTLADQAKAAFKQFHDAKSQEVSRVSGTKAIVAASIFIAYRSMGAPRTLREICALTGVSVKRIRSSLMEIERLVPQLKPTQLVLIDKDTIIRFCNKLNLKKSAHSDEIQKLARHLYDGALAGRTMTTIYATSIYIIAFLVTKNVQTGATATALMQKISVATGAAVRTIREAYQYAYPDVKNHLPQGHEYKSYKALPIPRRV